LTDLHFIEVREGWKNYYLFCFLGFVALIIFSCTYPESRQSNIDIFFGKWTFAKLPLLITIYGMMGICLFFYFDKRVKLKIDRNGIWTLKYKEILWTDIWYFNTTILNQREGNLYYIKFRLKDTENRFDKEIKIRYRRMDKDFEEVRGVISYFAKTHNIQDLGHENEI
jgi:hypothetical protein